MINDIQNSNYQEQKKVRPDIEIVINEFLEGDTLKTALDFIAWLKKIKLLPDGHRRILGISSIKEMTQTEMCAILKQEKAIGTCCLVEVM